MWSPHFNLNFQVKHSFLKFLWQYTGAPIGCSLACQADVLAFAGLLVGSPPTALPSGWLVRLEYLLLLLGVPLVELLPHYIIQNTMLALLSLATLTLAAADKSALFAQYP